MGRRALPKIDPNVDYSRYLRRLEELGDHVTIDELLPGTGPVELEIGSGKGLFLCTAAQANPSHRFIGIELAKKYAEFSAYRLAQTGVENAVMLSGDGLRLANQMLPDESLDAIHVYFPDPWWKSRHRKRRVMQEPLINSIHRLLVPGGTFHFWTDVEEYFHKTLRLMTLISPLVGPLNVEAAEPNHDLDYRTHFERRMRGHEKAVYRSQFYKAKPADS